jgi:hypothetical protein
VLGKTPSIIFTALVLLVFAAALYEANSFPYLGAIFPVAAALPGIVMGLSQLVLDARAPREPLDPAMQKRTRSAMVYLLSLVSFLLLILLFGFGVASALFTFAFLLVSVRMHWMPALAYSVVIVVLAVAMSRLLGLYWPEGLLLAQ